MGDHFVSMVDRLLTESTLEATLESKTQPQQSATASTSKCSSTDFLCHRMELDNRLSPKKLLGCRICHDEDEDSRMEVPCSCSGSLKYAHRKCVQRWCNEKGDTTCEICQQQFKPGYTAPTHLFHNGGIHVNFRGNWEISRSDLHNPQFIAMVTDNRDFLDSEFDDFTTNPSPTSLMCCRVVAIIFMLLLVLRHTVPIIITGAENYSVTLLVLRTIGILVPIYVMVKVITAIQASNVSSRFHLMAFMPSDGENVLPQLRPQSQQGLFTDVC